MNLLPSNNENLYGYKELFLEFKELYDKNLLPNKIIFCGSNGIGKSTALKILTGKVKPNLGNFAV